MSTSVNKYNDAGTIENQGLANSQTKDLANKVKTDYSSLQDSFTTNKSNPEQSINDATSYTTDLKSLATAENGGKPVDESDLNAALTAALTGAGLNSPEIGDLLSGDQSKATSDLTNSFNSAESLFNTVNGGG